MPEKVATTRQIARYFILFYTLAGLLFGVVIHIVGDHALREEVDNRIRVELDHLVETHRRGGDDALIRALKRRDDRGVNDLGYLFVDAKGARLGGELESTPPPPGWHVIAFDDPDGDVGEARALTAALGDGGRLTVAMELAPAENLLRTTIWMMVAGTAVLLAGGIVGGFLFTRTIRARLDTMNDTALAIIGGDMSQRIPVRSHDDEFGRLAHTLNRMLDGNSALIGSLRQVSSDIAHDLRTPIAHLRQRLERALGTAGTDAAQRREIEEAIRQSDSILSLFGALLRISEVESGVLQQYFQPFDLSAAVRVICDSYGPAAEDCGRRLDCDLADEIEIVGDRELVSQALVNLLENALRHTPPGTGIRVTLTRRSATALLTVEDDGPGVPEAALPNLTMRFTRTDRARSSPGFGLGLNIVQAIATAHDATLTIDNLHPGLRAQLYFRLRKGDGLQATG